MKPDWKKAPRWANFLAMDPDGDWFWCERKPFIDKGYWRDTGLIDWASPPELYWKKTLEQRPERK